MYDYDYDIYPDQEFHGDFQINGSVPVPNPFAKQIQQTQQPSQPLFFAEGGQANVFIPRKNFGLSQEDVNRFAQLGRSINMGVNDGNKNIQVNYERQYIPYEDASNPRSNGYYGAMVADNGNVMTDLSEGTFINDQYMNIPLITPRLNLTQRDYLLKHGGLGDDADMNAQIRKGAVEYAQLRMAQGLSPFAENSVDKAGLRFAGEGEGPTVIRRAEATPGNRYTGISNVDNAPAMMTMIPQNKSFEAIRQNEIATDVKATTGGEDDTNYDKLSFKQAFKKAAASKNRYDTFTWRGKKYLIDYK